MEVRDATEADAEQLAELTGAPADVMRNLVHDRTVRVAVDDEETRGFVSFDAEGDTVYVTQLEGDAEACDQLLAEPVRFADKEGMGVEHLVPETDEETRALLERAAFEAGGTGPRFDGVPTVRYRLER
ncbi:MAG: hypothetical protein ABEJ23_05705 [Haloarculaceae archaeon]